MVAGSNAHLNIHHFKMTRRPWLKYKDYDGKEQKEAMTGRWMKSACLHEAFREVQRVGDADDSQAGPLAHWPLAQIVQNLQHTIKACKISEHLHLFVLCFPGKPIAGPAVQHCAVQNTTRATLSPCIWRMHFVLKSIE